MPETIADEDARYAYDIVETICREVGPGTPGSPQERARAAIIGRELESHLGTRNVKLEEFAVAPGAFFGALPVGAFFVLLAALLNISVARVAGDLGWLIAIAALVCSLLAILPFVFEFVLYREFLDPFFPKRRSVNVIGTLRMPGTKNVKRLLLLAGHHDSAPENAWFRYLGYGAFAAGAIALVGVVAMISMSIIQLTGMAARDAEIVRMGTLGWPMLAFLIVPSILLAALVNLGRWRDGGTVPGAADNLAASALAVAMCRFLVRNPSCIPPDTEIRFASFGSEEAGLRGSRRYVERHLDELRGLDARLLNYEVVVHPEVAILSSDVNGTVRNSPEMVESAVAAAERAGVPYKVRPYAFGTGASDAGSFSRAGLKATTLLPFKMPQQVVAFYHQRWDRPDVLTMEPLLNVLKLTLEWIRGGGEGATRPEPATATTRRSREEASVP